MTVINYNFTVKNYKFAIINFSFPRIPKYVNVTPIYKNNSRIEERNYLRRLHSWMSLIFNDVLSKYQFGFKQGHSSQEYLLVAIEN